jgi:hypothetical protein
MQYLSFSYLEERGTDTQGISLSLNRGRRGAGGGGEEGEGDPIKIKSANPLQNKICKYLRSVKGFTARNDL